MVLGLVTVFICKHCVLLWKCVQTSEVIHSVLSVSSLFVSRCASSGCIETNILNVWNFYFSFQIGEKIVVVTFAWTLALPVYCHTFACRNCSADFDEMLYRGLLKGCVSSCCIMSVSFMSCLTDGVNYHTVFAHY